MQVTVIGGGNIGTLLAADCAYAGAEVTLCASDAPLWDKKIEVFDANEELLRESKLVHITNDIASAAREADLIWVTHPVHRIKFVANELLPAVHAGQIIGAVPGACAEFFFTEHVARGCTLFGLQRVHSIARLKQRGKSVYELGRKSEVQIASLPPSEARNLASIVSNLLDMPVAILPNYLVETLTPSNSILHTTRLYTMFSNWKPGCTYDKNVPFYETWDIKSSHLLLACDEELQTLCRKIEKNGLDLTGVVPLTVHYESTTAEAMTKKIANIPAFQGLMSPMRQNTFGRWSPDFDSRYFVADFGYGLAAIYSIAKLAKISTPNIDCVFNWYVKASGNTIVQFVPDTYEKLLALYRQS